MFNFFIGLAFGVILTAASFGAGGVGHGTYAPLVYTAPFVMLPSDAIGVVAVFAGPLLWAVYFQFIPKIERRAVRWLTLVALLVHLLAGTFVAAQDPAFARAWEQQRSGLIGFGVIFALAMATLFFFSLRERVHS
jgi:drug/metabolite transporter (DMT)-like permease